LLNFPITSFLKKQFVEIITMEPKSEKVELSFDKYPFLTDLGL
jgi:hypothetical protein